MLIAELNVLYHMILTVLEGIVAPDLWRSFSACMDMGGLEKKPLLDFKFFCGSFNFIQPFY